MNNSNPNIPPQIRILIGSKENLDPRLMSFLPPELQEALKKEIGQDTNQNKPEKS